MASMPCSAGDATSRIKEFAPNPGRNVSLVYKILF
jgi:hypothetical protein